MAEARCGGAISIHGVRLRRWIADGFILPIGDAVSAAEQELERCLNNPIRLHAGRNPN
jgi:hypothetical protein